MVDCKRKGTSMHPWTQVISLLDTICFRCDCSRPRPNSPHLILMGNISIWTFTGGDEDFKMFGSSAIMNQSAISIRGYDEDSVPMMQSLSSFPTPLGRWNVSYQYILSIYPFNIPSWRTTFQCTLAIPSRNTLTLIFNPLISSSWQRGRYFDGRRRRRGSISQEAGSRFRWRE